MAASTRQSQTAGHPAAATARRSNGVSSAAFATPATATTEYTRRPPQPRVDVVGDEHQFGRRLMRKPAHGYDQAHERIGGRDARGGRQARGARLARGARHARGFERRRVEAGARRRAWRFERRRQQVEQLAAPGAGHTQGIERDDGGRHSGKQPAGKGPAGERRGDQQRPQLGRRQNAPEPPSPARRALRSSMAATGPGSMPYSKAR